MRGLTKKKPTKLSCDAMTADSIDPAGIYFGTRSGQIFGSRDERKNWQKILDGLPSVVCVRSAIFERASGDSTARSRRAPVSTSGGTKSVTCKSRRTVYRQ